MSFCDLDSSTKDYAQRFSGEVGVWFLDVQKGALIKCIEALKVEIKSAADIGGGHGQIIRELQASGIETKLVVSEVAAVGEAAPFISNEKEQVVVSPLPKISLGDKSVDLVTSFRILPHTDDWRVLLDEMCRVSRVGVIVDYPAKESINALSDLFFGLKKKAEKNTRTYKLFSKKEIREQMQKNEYELVCSVGQYVLPMVVYRIVKVATVGKVIEGILKLVGLGVLGSPVVEGYRVRKT